MNAERWQQIKALLDTLADLDPSRHSAWLDESCGDDLELRREVEKYLSYEDEVSALSATIPAAPLLEALEDSQHADEGRLVGPYRLVEQIGSGGMGSVYRARRESEFEQTVALKLVRAGLETPDVVRRFHTERQILARLEHPNVARLLDGGTTEEGRPYFVMELIEGLPIDRYCDEHRLSIRDRLELLLQVCDALRFAHRNLVLHLDLKPGNILVTQGGVPKLLDFGIGKLLREGRRHAPAEGTGSPRRMTLRYASPEQLLGDPMSTASDLYSLGVVLYELLTGRLPCGAETDSQAAVAWSICHDPPQKPSTAVRDELSDGRLDGRLDDDDDGTGTSRQTLSETRERSLSTLTRRLRGDVDAIALKALQKNPADRYSSVEQLAADLRRYLDGLPVEARQGNLTYRLGKYAWRHRLGVSIAGVGLAMILAFTAALSSQLENTERQRRRSERISSFLVDLFRAAEPGQAGGEPSVRELIDIGRKRLETDLEDEAELRAELLGTLGQVYYRLGHYDAAKATQQDAIQAMREVGPDHSLIARALNDLSAAAFAQGDYARAERFCRESIDMRRRLGAEADLTKSLNNLATMLMRQGKLEDAEAIYREGLERRRAELGDRHENVARSLRNLATVLQLRGEFDAAEPLMRESLDIRLEVHGPDTVTVATTLASLARLAYSRDRLDAAEPYFIEALDIRRRHLGPDHLLVAALENDFAKVLLERGELDTAGVLLANALGPIYRDKAEGDSIRADLESVYGSYLAARGRFDEAEVCLSNGHRALQALRGNDSLIVQSAQRRLQGFHQLRDGGKAQLP